MNNHTRTHASDRIETITKSIRDASNELDLTKLYIERGHCYELLEDSVNSIRDFLTALDTATSNSDIVHIKSMVALALAKKSEKEQAIFWAMSAVDQDSCNAEGYHTLGLVCDICGFLNLAIESLRRATDLEPHRWDSVRVLGSCLRENGQVREAINTLSRYVTHNPDEPLGLYELAWSLHVLSGGDMDKLHTVKEMYERALRANPGSNMRAIIERKLRDINGEGKPGHTELF